MCHVNIALRYIYTLPSPQFAFVFLLDCIKHIRSSFSFVYSTVTSVDSYKTHLAVKQAAVIRYLGG